MNLTATYSPEDNKLRLYSNARLDAETYSRVKAAGFSWAPRQQLFVAPMWTPQRADLLIKLCGEIGDEDKSLAERATERAERFGGYGESRAKDALQAQKKVDAILEHIPFGQPILVGHHSEKRARRDAERIGEGLRKSIKMWDTSKYWAARAEAAMADAKYKERPDVRARRIKKIEADRRQKQRIKAEAERFILAWSKPGLTMQEASEIASIDHGYFTKPTNEKPGGESLWDATQGRCASQPTVEQITERAVQKNRNIIAWADRWLEHYDNRLAYERTMLAADGGLEIEKTKPEVGGACQCLWSPRGGWSLIQRVNPTSVTILVSYGNPNHTFTKTRPFDKLTAVMSRAEVDAAREAGLISEENKIGFILRPKLPQNEAASEAAQPVQVEAKVKAPAITSGIQTPNGPLPLAQQELFKPQVGHSQNRKIGL